MWMLHRPSKAMSTRERRMFSTNPPSHRDKARSRSRSRSRRDRRTRKTRADSPGRYGKGRTKDRTHDRRVSKSFSSGQSSSSSGLISSPLCNDEPKVNSRLSRFGHPTRYVVAKNLPPFASELDLAGYLPAHDPVRIEIVRENADEDKKTGKEGLTPPYALIEFDSLPHAIEFVEDNGYEPGQFYLDANHILSLDYTVKAKVGGIQLVRRSSDWLCEKCCWLNYENIDKCTNCNTPQMYTCTRVSFEGNPIVIQHRQPHEHQFVRPQVVDAEAQNIDVRTNAVIAVEGIAVATSADSVAESFRKIAPVKAVWIGRHALDPNSEVYSEMKRLQMPLTISRAFVQFLSREDAVLACQKAQSTSLTVDSRPITATIVTSRDYLEDESTGTVPSSLIENLQQQALWGRKNLDARGGSSSPGSDRYSRRRSRRDRSYSRSRSRSRNRDRKRRDKDGSGDRRDSDRDRDRERRRDHDKHSRNGKEESPSRKKRADTEMTAENDNFPKAADYGLVESFAWDEQSGSFFDASTGYYFDVIRNLYYFQGVFYGYDQQTASYVEVADPLAAQAQETETKMDVDEEESNAGAADQTGDEAAELGPIKIALGSVDAVKAEMKSVFSTPTVPKPSVAVENTRSPLEPPKSNGLPEEGYIDKARLCCLLCRRQFKTLEKLQKHEAKSSLHRENILAKQKQRMNDFTKKLLTQKESVAVPQKLRPQQARSLSGASNSTRPATTNQSSNNLQDEYLAIMAQYESSNCGSGGHRRPLVK